MSETTRKQEVINGCLKTFMRRGLNHTSTKDLSQALHMHESHIFYYFKTKDDIVIACAEEAKKKIEIDLIGSALKNIENPALLEKDLYERATEMRELMQFFVTVCALPKYRERIQPVLEDLSVRYKHYTEKFAEKLGCTYEEVSPYVYIVINTLLSYMLFGYEKGFFAPQIELVRTALINLLAKKNAEGNK